MRKFLISSAATIAMLAGSPAIAQAPQPTSAGQASRSHHRRTLQPLTRAAAQARAAAMFAKLDTNRDGFITKDELNAAAAQRAQKAEQRAARFDPSKLFDGLDVNHDGQVSAEELKAASGKGRMLARADANKDGTISRSEFDAAAERMKARMAHASLGRGATATRLFEEADADKDGRVTLAEMQQAALASFDRADLNHDGTITPDERQRARKLFKSPRRSGQAAAKQ